MSYPPTNGAGYDLSLLYPVSDPVVRNPHSRDPISAVAPLSSGPPQPQLYTTGVEKLPNSSTVGHSPGVVSYAHKGESKGYEPVVAVVPWYRTRRGITIIIAITIVVVGAMVGGIVGGTHHSSKPQSNTSGQQSTGNTTQQGHQTNGVGAPPPLPHPQAVVVLRPTPAPPPPPWVLPLALDSRSPDFEDVCG